MRLICSAFRSGAAQNDNALKTAQLIQYLQIERLKVELALGVYKGQREIALVITGFNSYKCMTNIAKAVCRLFGQESVYISHEHSGHLLFADGTMQELGPEVRGMPMLATNETYAKLGAVGYTMFLDGSTITGVESLMKEAA